MQLHEFLAMYIYGILLTLLVFAKSPFGVKLIHLLKCNMIKTNANVAV